MKFIPGIALILFTQACGSGRNDNSIIQSPPVSSVNGSINKNQTQPVHTVSVLEVMQVANYTYLRVKEVTDEYWIAAPTINARIGDTLYYETGMLMTKFESKELKRSFDKILFVDRISADMSALKNNIVKDTLITPIVNNHPVTSDREAMPAKGVTKDSIKQSIKVDPPSNGVSIATLLKNPTAYAGKTVIVRGKITKYTAGVMGKNWIHIQDGTDYNGKFEIVITTLAELKDGETATFEGSITLNKDLGYGYFFEVLMENAKVIK